MATIDLGKVAFVWKGTYNSGTTYEEKDVVQYTDSGELSSYIYVNASSASGQTPSTGGTVNTTYWSKMAGGTTLSVGNNKIVTTDSSGNVSSVALGTAGQALKVNSSANGLEFGSAGKNIVAKAFYNSSALGSSTDLVNLNITASTANPTLHVMGVFAIGSRATGNLDDENIQFDMKYSTDGGSSYTTAQAGVYKTDVYAPGQDDTHNNTYDTHLRQACTSFQVTCSAGTVINVVVRLDYSHITNSRTVYINRSEDGSSGRQGSHLIVYEQ